MTIDRKTDLILIAMLVGFPVVLALLGITCSRMLSDGNEVFSDGSGCHPVYGDIPDGGMTTNGRYFHSSAFVPDTHTNAAWMQIGTPGKVWTKKTTTIHCEWDALSEESKERCRKAIQEEE